MIMVLSQECEQPPKLHRATSAQFKIHSAMGPFFSATSRYVYIGFVEIHIAILCRQKKWIKAYQTSVF